MGISGQRVSAATAALPTKTKQVVIKPIVLFIGEPL
jgi:hypothetical protein